MTNPTDREFAFWQATRKSPRWRGITRWIAKRPRVLRRKIQNRRNKEAFRVTLAWAKEFDK